MLVLSRLGRFCHRRRGVVLAGWVVVLVLAGIVSGVVGSGFRSEFTLPDVESARGFDILDQRFGGTGSGQTGSIVFTAPQGVSDPSVQAPMEGFLARVEELPDVDLVSPYVPEGQGQVSPDGTIAFASLELPRDISLEDALDVAKEIRALEPGVPGLEIELGGQILAEFEPPQSEILGLSFAIVILILAFGSVLAMGLPIGTAVFGIGVGAAVVTVLSRFADMPDFTLTLGVMIGLGVGIDYALFIVTRYRENIRRGMTPEDATGVAINTAGRAVLFAGTTVVISLLGMLLMGVGFVAGLGIGAAVTVAITMAASVTLLPALLGIAGDRIEVTRWRGLLAAGLIAVALVGIGLQAPIVAMVAIPLAVVVVLAGFAVSALRREVPRPAPKPVERTLAYRWSHVIQRHPWPAAIGGTALLVLLALPVLGLRLGFSDEGNYPEDTTTRKAYDLMVEGFGPGFNGPILIASELPGGAADQAAVARVDASLQQLQDDGQVAFASPAVLNDPASPSAALWRLIPTTSPQDEATTDLVDGLRDRVLPQATAGSGLDPAVTGTVAINVDFSKYLAARLPLFFGVVLALSFLLLMTVFRSVLVPLKAVIMNLISIAAAYGVVVAVFQWGWFGSVIGIGQGAPIEPFVPMMMFAIVFGLSMDYEVFLLSRVKEEYDRTRDNTSAVADGLASTARVITAAAAIMVFIFGSFLLETDRVIKLFGVGLASAVLLDATVVRMLLVPATMELLGDRNWWLPRWLDRILPNIDVEGGASQSDDDQAGPASPAPEKVPAGI